MIKNKRKGGNNTMKPKEYVKQIKKHPLHQQFKKGTVYTNTKDIINKDQLQIREANKQLLKKLIRNPAIIEVMLEEENLNKIKLQTEHKIAIYNENNIIIYTAQKTGLTLKQLQSELKNNLIPNTHEDLNKQEYQRPIQEKLRKLNYKNITPGTSGRYTKIDVQTIIRTK